MPDILYLAWNRLEFTRFSFNMLLRNTDWDLVDKLVIYDDESTDGTTEFLHEAAGRCPVQTEINVIKTGSPVAVMNRFVEITTCETFAKIDNDIVVPPGWLNNLCSVMDANPDLELLGMEAGRMDVPRGEWDGTYTWTEASHIGGVGLMRRRSFLRRPTISVNGQRFGFTEWQHEYKPVRGWITPDLLVSSLDFVPLEPWVSLTEKYKETEGLQRQWGKYHAGFPYWWEWWPEESKEWLP